MKKIKAFTLVELIVVITILAILGTIGFVSLQGYSTNARDGVRVSDIKSIERVLMLYQLSNGGLPLPTNPIEVTYSGAVIWKQGTFGEETRKIIGPRSNISQVPKDPLIGNEYTYSLLSIGNEYQLGTITEGGGDVSYINNLANQAQALDKLKVLLRGNYNGKVLRTRTGSLDYILALPSITTTNYIDIDIQDILVNKQLVYNNYNNLPSSYNDSGYEMNGGFDYEVTDPVIYSGNIQNLRDEDELLEFTENLKGAYDGTILENKDDFKEVISIDTVSKKEASVNLVKTYFNKHIGGLNIGENFKIKEAKPNFYITSDGFINNGNIPLSYSCTSSNNSIHNGSNRSPQLSWVNTPEGTTHFAIIMDDEGSGSGGLNDDWVHWGVYNIPSTTTSLSAGASPKGNPVSGTNSTNGILANNDWNVNSYIGVCPQSGMHTYKTTIYALNNSVTPGQNTRAEFASLNSNKILGSATISGRFSAPPQFCNIDLVHNATITAPSVTYHGSNNLPNLTDNIVSTSGASDYAFHPINANNKKVIFDFPSEGVISKIRIYNRTSCCSHRLRDSEVVLYLNGIEVNRRTITSSSNIINLDYVFNENNKYDKIEIIFDGDNQNLREIEVFNYSTTCN